MGLEKYVDSTFVGRYKDDLAFWKALANNWKGEHDAVKKKLRSIDRRIRRDIKEYGMVQKETLKRLSQLTR